MKFLLSGLLAGMVFVAAGKACAAATEPATGSAGGARTVLIEAAIVEMAIPVRNGQVLDLLDGQAQLLPASSAAGGSLDGVTQAARVNGDLDAMVKKLARRTGTRILFRPRIQTSHGVPAILSFPGDPPAPGAAELYAGAFPGPIRRVRLNETALEVTPLVEASGIVTMNLKISIDREDGSVTIMNVGTVPVTSTSCVNTKVSVRDGETFMLAGFEGSAYKPANAGGVRFPKELPVPAALHIKSGLQKSEIIILVRPTVRDA
jgi:type II secretory pathway component HofQ